MCTFVLVGGIYASFDIMFVFNTPVIRQLYGNVFFALPSDKKTAPLPAQTAIQEETPTIAPEALSPASINEVGEDKSAASAEIQDSPSTTPIPSPAHPLAGSAKIIWKTRPSAKIILLLKTEEFNNRFLTNGLRFFLEDANFPKEEIGFGVLPDHAEGWDVQDMPAACGLLFVDLKNVENPEYIVKDKKIYLLQALQTLAGDISLQNALKALLIKIKKE